MKPDALPLIDTPLFKALALEVVAGRGDFQYRTGEESFEACLYVAYDEYVAANDRLGIADELIEGLNDVPVAATTCGCLIGEIITAAGLMRDDIAASCHSALELNDVWADAETANLAHHIQILQDGGLSWGYCLKRLYEPGYEF